MPFSSKKGKSLLKEIQNLFFTKSIYVEPGHKIIFVCGGPIRPGSRNGRASFLRYGAKSLRQYRLVRAEIAGQDIADHSIEPTFIELSEFENLIGNVADCTILFSESPGSIAELGLFSGNRAIRKKMLVICRSSHQKKSFITDGPLREIEKDSAFGRTLFMDRFTPKQFDEMLKDRLSGSLTFKVAHEIDITSASTDTKILFYVIYELVRIFRALNIERLKIILDCLFPAATIRVPDLQHLLALQMASGFLVRSEKYKSYFVVKNAHHRVLRIEGASIPDWIARLTGFYRQEQDRTLLSIIKEQSHAT